MIFSAPLTPPLSPPDDELKAKKTPERIEFENSIDGLQEESEEELTEHNLRASLSCDALLLDMDDDDMSDSDLEYVFYRIWYCSIVYLFILLNSNLIEIRRLLHIFIFIFWWYTNILQHHDGGHVKVHIVTGPIRDEPTRIQTKHMLRADVQLVNIFNCLAFDWIVKRWHDPYMYLDVIVSHTQKWKERCKKHLILIKNGWILFLFGKKTLKTGRKK